MKNKQSSSNNILYIPASINRNFLDDKMAYFVHYLYTYPFKYKERVKTLAMTQKNLKHKPTESDGFKNFQDSSIYKISDTDSSGNLSGVGSSYVVTSDTDDTSYSYVVTSDSMYHEWDGFIPIYSKSMRKIITTKDYGRVKKELLESGIITCDWSYSNFNSNRFTMKYALTDIHRFTEPTVYENSNIRFINKLNNLNLKRRSTLTPVLKKLEDKLFEVDFDDVSASNYVKSTVFKNSESKGAREIGISIMKNRPSSNYYLHEGPISKRIFSPITSLPRDLRPYLSFQGRSLWDVDISCALPTLFNTYLIDLNYNDVKEYRYLTSDNGENYGLYDYLGELWNENNRDEVKILKMVLLFGRGNTIRDHRSKFNDAFPNVHNIIKKMKRKSYKILSTILMKMEREIMIDTVANNLLERNDKIPLLTIHDGILTTEEYSEIIKSRIQKEIKNRIGLIPKVKIKPLISS